jgi:hypothetical protein
MQVREQFELFVWVLAVVAVVRRQLLVAKWLLAVLVLAEDIQKNLLQVFRL